MNLNEKIVLITGGSSGIGLAIAKMLKEKGAKVIITARNEEKLSKAAEEYGCDYFTCDVADEKQVTDLYEYVKNKYGYIDVLVNNAGFGKFAKLHELKTEMMESIFETNVKGAMMMAREASKIFMERNSGAIINISSTAGTKGFPGGTAYVASKFALKGMTECWRVELRPYNVRVVLINPSEVQTAFGENIRTEINPTKLLAEDIAHAVVSSLEMDERGFITELTVFATNPQG